MERKKGNDILWIAIIVAVGAIVFGKKKTDQPATEIPADQPQHNDEFLHSGKLPPPTNTGIVPPDLDGTNDSSVMSHKTQGYGLD